MTNLKQLISSAPLKMIFLSLWFEKNGISSKSVLPQGLFFSCPLPREALNILLADLKYSSLFLSCFVCLAVAYINELIECCLLYTSRCV